MAFSGLNVIAITCMLLSVVFLVAALSAPNKSEGQEVLLRVSREAGRTRIIDDKETFGKRVVEPFMVLMLRMGRTLVPTNRLAKLDERLEKAGYPLGWDMNRVLALKALCLLVGAAVGLFLGLLFGSLFIVLLIPLCGGMAFYMPDYILDKRAAKRADQMRKGLADTVDMLNLTLAAGIGFDSALKIVSQNTDGPLAQEFGRVVQEITIGKTRSEALMDLADRTKDDDLRRFCVTCVQAERRGTPFADILALQSQELRVKRRQLAEEKAQKVPVKILFPMMVCVLPTLLLAVIGPAAIQIMENGLGGK